MPSERTRGKWYNLEERGNSIYTYKTPSYSAHGQILEHIAQWVHGISILGD